MSSFSFTQFLLKLKCLVTQKQLLTESEDEIDDEEIKNLQEESTEKMETEESTQQAEINKEEEPANQENVPSFSKLLSLVMLK